MLRQLLQFYGPTSLPTAGTFAGVLTFNACTRVPPATASARPATDLKLVALGRDHREARFGPAGDPWGLLRKGSI